MPPKGHIFEDVVAVILDGFVAAHPTLVRLEAKPRVALQQGEIVIPDFDLIVELAHQRSHFFIECHDLETEFMDLLHKIQHVREKQQWKTFLFVYPSLIGSELCRALDVEGIMHLNLSEFWVFIERLRASLDGSSSLRASAQ